MPGPMLTLSSGLVFGTPKKTYPGTYHRGNLPHATPGGTCPTLSGYHPRCPDSGSYVRRRPGSKGNIPNLPWSPCGGGWGVVTVRGHRGETPHGHTPSCTVMWTSSCTHGAKPPSLNPPRGLIYLEIPLPPAPQVWTVLSSPFKYKKSMQKYSEVVFTKKVGVLVQG